MNWEGRSIISGKLFGFIGAFLLFSVFLSVILNLIYHMQVSYIHVISITIIITLVGILFRRYLQ
jgi:hypothetical protein